MPSPQLLTGVAITVQLLCLYESISIARRRNHLYPWLFVAAFALMAARRAMAVLDSGDDPPTIVALLDSALLPLAISVLFLIALSKHRSYLQYVAEQMREAAKRDP